MISVDEAIARSKDTWHPDRAHVENETAYQDRTILAAEVISLREALTETERELQTVVADTGYDHT